MVLRGGKGKIKTITAVAIPRYQESKRACCANTFSPTSIGNQQQDNRNQPTIRKPKENCDLRKCKYAKSQAEASYCNTQRLLDKIQSLKKSIQNLETAQSSIKQESSKTKDVLSQTEEQKVTDLNSAREVLNNCIRQMTKLKAFLEDENCWWRMFKNMEFDCCDQKLPHLHGYLDGTMVTLKMLEEKLDTDDNFKTSTPTKSNSITFTNPKVASGQRREYEEYCTNNLENNRTKFKDSGIGPSLSFQLGRSKSHESCQRHCPFSCTPENPRCNNLATKNEATIDPESPDAEDIVERFKGTVPRLSSMVKLPNETHAGMNSAGRRDKSRLRATFSSENTAGRKISVADISTSMDLILKEPSTNTGASTQGLRGTALKIFALRSSRTNTRNEKPRSKETETQI
ncbi:uncharacterized protein LOC128890624 [Hylaeus anthracinus]|uniref:uncharacterized protein LOC128890624 n=1 Tax=Hylaeus anthracinus TaxID=313031 RepID=UPI0023B9CB5E|nr:uncharacterized protein LOC128890624 [Hylaeus anthracinus]